MLIYDPYGASHDECLAGLMEDILSPGPPRHGAVCQELNQMNPQTPLLAVEHGKRVIHIRFMQRDIIDEPVIQEVGEKIDQLIIGVPQPRVVIDFSKVQHFSSAALGMLIALNNHIRQIHGQLRLCSIHTSIYEVFEITKLNRLFEIHNQVEDAIKSFQ